MERFLQRIVVPTDFSPASERALDFAIPLARREQAAISLVHVLDPQALAPRATRIQPAVEQMVLEPELERSIQEELVRRAEARLVGIQFDTTLVLGGRVAEAIVEHARKKSADMIVISTHGRTGFAHLTIGSVAERVVRLAACPVLTVRAEE